MHALTYSIENDYYYFCASLWKYLNVSILFEDKSFE